MEEIAGLPEVGKLFTGYMTDLEQARQFDRAIDQLSLDKIWNGFVEAHGFEEDSSLNKFVLAHQLGKDLVFVASLFVGIGEINSFFKIANLLKKIKGVLSIRVIRLVKKLRKNLDTNDWKKLNSLSDLNEAFLAKLDGMGDQARRLLNDFDTETLKLFVDRPGLIDSWKVLDDAREANLADRLDDIEFVDDYVNSSGKTHAQVKTAIDNADGFSAWKLAEGGGSLLTKLDNLGLSSLTTKLDDIGGVSKTKFLDEFAGASDDALIAINNKTDLIDYWKANGNIIKNKSYPNVGHKPWATTRQEIVASAKPSEVKILNAIENATPPTNSQVAVAGAYSDELSSVIIKYNDKNFNVDLLEPELRQHIDYLQVIKNDFDAGGDLYQKLYSNVPLEKIQNAGVVGVHAEVLATNEAVKKLKAAGKFSGIEDLNKIEVLVKGKAASFGNMCRCPHCFHIIDGVKMIGNQ